MLEGRYRDKKYLVRYDLDINIFNKFDLVVTDVIPVRNVFILKTNKGNKVFKKIDYSIEDVNFIYNAMKYIKQKFDRVIDFEKTVDGEIYTIWNNDIYCIMDLVEGKECDFNNPIDVSIASKGLGELHSASEGFRSNLAHKNAYGKTIDNFSRRLEEMQFFKNIANLHEVKNKFDEIFLENIDYHIEEIQKSIEFLKKSNYYKLCSEEDKIVLCHHDLAYHNIMINEDKAYFVDFDFAIIDLKIHDLSNFINKVIKNFAFDNDKAISIINDYCTSNRLDKRELEALYGILSFPEDFYNISRDYYTKRKEWDEQVFLDRLIKKVDYKEYRREFLDEFNKSIKSL